EEEETEKVLKGYTEFEPEVAQLLQTLAPKALESEIFSALLEGAASFHVSQQRAMAAATQSVEVEQLLPLTLPAMPEEETSTALKGYTEFEPEVERLLITLAPKALESEIFSALLEGAASFHVSQQRAMAAATDNADELGQNLSRIMNRARQDSITTEIMEIVGGAEALRSGK
ncbi:MAG TPA: FoF1 ATP synthase subunit gamma, partial [Acidimicrobiales bacterium]|nr:FoF1 ATP synthase subunit gamma [Acidimicrobiales bacterium]